jgi:DNA-binding CsgD family transcriptional regulator
MKKTPYDYESPLSDAEREVFWAVVRGDGLSNAQIANKLKRSVKTVEHHLGEIFFKLNIKNRTQLALFYRHGHIKRD